MIFTVLDLPPPPYHWIAKDEVEVPEMFEESSQSGVKRKLPDDFENSFENQGSQFYAGTPTAAAASTSQSQSEMVYANSHCFEEPQSQSEICEQDIFQQGGLSTNSQSTGSNTQASNQNSQPQATNNTPQLSLNQTVIEQSLNNDLILDQFNDPNNVNQESFLDSLDHASNLMDEFPFGNDEMESLYQEINSTSNTDWNSALSNNNDSTWNSFTNDSSQAYTNDPINFEDLDIPIENGSGHLQNDFGVHDDQMHSAIKSIMSDPMVSNGHQEQFSNFNNNTGQSSNSGIGTSGSFGMRTNHIPSSVPDHMLDEAVKSIL